MLDCAFDAIVTMTIDGTIVEMNAAAERMFGMPRTAAEGRKLAEMITPPDGDFSSAIGQRVELDALGPGDRRIPVELSVARIEAPERTLFTAWIRDLTERRRVEEALRLSEAQLRQAHKMEAIGRLAGGVAHDFNNVLTAIFGYADLLIDGLDLDRSAPRRRRGDQARGEPRRRPDAAAAGVQPQAGDAAAAREPERDHRQHPDAAVASWSATTSSCASDPAPDLGDVIADPGQIEQVLMNLAANARDAMPEGGRLTIATANEDLAEDDARGRWRARPGPFRDA